MNLQLMLAKFQDQVGKRSTLQPWSLIATTTMIEMTAKTFIYCIDIHFTKSTFS